MISLIDDAKENLEQKKEKSESLPITRDEAVNLLNSFPQDKADKNHYLMSEAIMKYLAKYFNEDEDEDYWAMLGLLHDVDWAETKNDSKKHLTIAPKILKEKGFDQDFIDIIISHGYGFDCADLKDKIRTKKIEHALAAAETLTGIIYAYALMRGAKMTDMEVKGLKKKFKDKKFAAGCNREIIKEIEKTGLSIDEFFEISIDAIKSIKEVIGLE